MNTKYRISIIAMLLYSFILHVPIAHGKDTLRLKQISNVLDTLTQNYPEFNKDTDISVGNIPLPELIRNVAFVTKLNIMVKGNESTLVSCNFSKAKVKDLIYYLCDEYNQNIRVIGNIVTVYPAAEDRLPPPIVVHYNTSDSLMSVEFCDAPLMDVAKVLTENTGINLIVDKELYNTNVSAFFKKITLNDALEYIASINSLHIDWDTPKIGQIRSKSSVNQDNYVPTKKVSRPYNFTVTPSGKISLSIENAHIADIITGICEKMNMDYHFITPITGTTSIFFNEVSADMLFSSIFLGTQFTYYRENGIYFFGKSEKDMGMLSIEITPLLYRAVDQVITLIPDKLKEGLQIKSFDELNSIIVSGNNQNVNRVVTFLKNIDKPVPLITIDIIIAESSKSRLDEVGISFGKGSAPIVTTGDVLPSADISIGAGTINKLINDFNGFGSIKIGKVSPNFYAGLRFLESNGDIAVESTPKLSTLNGREAVLTSGETQYYKEVNNNYIGTETPLQSTSYLWKSVDANLTIKITLYVSSDSLITMNIDISQSEFTSRVEKDSPPGIVVRSFKSIIRVADKEMVLLGGIDKNSTENSSHGVPWIARAPVLKWIFGNTKKSKNESKLNVFIKPTIVQ